MPMPRMIETRAAMTSSRNRLPAAISISAWVSAKPSPVMLSTPMTTPAIAPIMTIWVTAIPVVDSDRITRPGAMRTPRYPGNVPTTTTAKGPPRARRCRGAG